MEIKSIKLISLSTLAIVSGVFPLLGSADSVVNDDHIVTFSQCVGTDCVNGESFGFDTLRLKENNTRIKFQDTSNSASFPTNDWQLTANDSSNGGANRFSIDDVDSGRTPFTVEAGAPSDTLFLDSTGNVGLGTSTPLVEMHVVNGDSPALRLEQNASAGFVAQSWDLLGNESGFFVRDITNGSKLPVRVRAGAPTDALDIAANGNVSSVGQICANSGGVPACIGSVPSSRLFKNVVGEVDTAQILNMVSQLAISRWSYIDNDATVEHIGPIAEEFKAIFNLNGDVSDRIATVDITGVALASIKELHKQLQIRDAELENLKQELAEIKQLLLSK